jgi:hypothetical protein
VILVSINQRITWANERALTMHGVDSVEAPSGEAFAEEVVEVAPAGNNETTRVHPIKCRARLRA